MSLLPEPSGGLPGRGLIDLDVERPNVARMYDYYLGGKNHYPPDRVAAEEVLRIVPEARRMARDNRAFLERAARFLLEMGVRQFLDLGTGLPTPGNLRDVAQESVPGVRSVHVDNDKVVCTHARALLAEAGQAAVVEEDLRAVTEIVESRTVRELIDFGRPVGVVLTAVLPFITDDDEAMEIVGRYRSMMATGSYLVLSHGAPGTLSGRRRSAVEGVYAEASAQVSMREPEVIGRFFDGLRLVPPGLVDVAHWNPAGPVAVHDGAYMAGAVACLGA